jgi:hypothetical protein
VSPRRAIPVLLLALGMAGGAPIGQTMAATSGSTMSAPLPAEALPVPPPKPGPGLNATGFAPAPMPDPDLQRPLADLMAERPHTAVVPRLFERADRANGEGYVEGSAPQYDPPDRRSRPSPSINLRVPLQ